MDGLARLQHDVVGRVHDGVYGPHAGGVDPAPHPKRRLLPRPEVGDAPEIVSRTQILGLDPEPEVVGRLPSCLESWFRDPVVRPKDGGEFPGNPDHAPQIRPVRGNVDVEHGLPDGEVVGDGTPHLVGIVEQQYPPVVGGDAELALAHHHPVGCEAAQLRLSELRPVGHHAAWKHDGHAGAGVRVRGAGHDLDLPAPEVDLGDKEPVGVGMRPELDHLAHHDLAVDHAEAVDAVDLLAAEGEEIYELFGGEVEVEVLV